MCARDLCEGHLPRGVPTRSEIHSSAPTFSQCASFRWNNLKLGVSEQECEADDSGRSARNVGASVGKFSVARSTALLYANCVPVLDNRATRRVPPTSRAAPEDRASISFWFFFCYFAFSSANDRNYRLRLEFQRRLPASLRRIDDCFECCRR